MMFRMIKGLGLAWVIGLVGAVTALLFLAWLAGEVIEGDTRHFDDWAATSLHNYASPPLTSFMSGITLLGSTEVLLVLGAFVVIAFLIARWRRETLLFLVTMAGASLLNRVLKLSFQRPRPQPYFDLIAPASYSFPSGHALLSFCFYGAVALVLASHLRRSSQRMAVWIFTGTLILLVGVSRVYLGVHYASDVIAGFTVAFIWVMAVNFGQVITQAANARSRQARKRSGARTEED